MFKSGQKVKLKDDAIPLDCRTYHVHIHNTHHRDDAVIERDKSYTFDRYVDLLSGKMMKIKEFPPHYFYENMFMGVK